MQGMGRTGFTTEPLICVPNMQYLSWRTVTGCRWQGRNQGKRFDPPHFFPGQTGHRRNSGYICLSTAHTKFF
jgi:hypothetical protein